MKHQIIKTKVAGNVVNNDHRSLQDKSRALADVMLLNSVCVELGQLTQREF